LEVSWKPPVAAPENRLGGCVQGISVAAVWLFRIPVFWAADHRAAALNVGRRQHFYDTGKVSFPKMGWACE